MKKTICMLLAVMLLVSAMSGFAFAAGDQLTAEENAIVEPKSITYFFKGRSNILYGVDDSMLIGQNYHYGNPVKVVQAAMNYLGYTDYSNHALVVDGTYGTSTMQAINKFQIAKGLTVDGVIGPASWLKLNQLVGSHTGITLPGI